MEAATQTKNVGRIEEIQGVVIEAVFPEQLPHINNAITVDRGEAGTLVDNGNGSLTILGLSGATVQITDFEALNDHLVIDGIPFVF